MSTRTKECFDEISARGQGGLVIYVTAGDPNPDTFEQILSGLPAAGADIIEIGMPFTDPMADGPAIQLANQRALGAGMTLPRTLAAVKRFRASDPKTPIILMGYYNPIYRYGVPDFIDDAVSAGVDGLIIVDLPPEEDEELCHPALVAGLHWVRLTTPTTDKKRLSQVLHRASGFVYHVSVAGVTGTSSADQNEIRDAVKQIRDQCELPVVVGFGIRSPEQVAEVSAIADAAVVGSAVVDCVRESLEINPDPAACVDAVLAKVRDLATGKASRQG